MEEAKPEWRYPGVEKGRVAHIDADFLAYQVSYEKADEEPKTIDDMQHNAKIVVEHLKKLAGAEQLHMHLTPSLSDKGGRYEQAMLKPYQGNRIDTEKPRYLHIMRDWLAREWPGTQHTDCEADDGMSSMQYAAIARGERDKSIIVTKDKDLSMVPGLHVNWDTGEITDTSGFGEIELLKGKLRGRGTKFFWGQMLVGDPADNTQGLPLLSGRVLNKIKPTGPIKKAQEIIAAASMYPSSKVEKARDTLASRPAGLIGPATAILILDKLKSDREARDAIQFMYKLYGDEIGFKNYRDGSPISAGQAFDSEAKLHWMRINKSDPDDVIKWMGGLK